MLRRALFPGIASVLLSTAAASQVPCTAIALEENLGGGSQGTGGQPGLVSTGLPAVNFPYSLSVQGGLPGGAGLLLVSALELTLPLPEFQAVAHVGVPFLSFPFTLDGSGTSAPLVPFASLPENYCAQTVLVQAFFIDPGGPGGLAFTDGLRLSFGGKQLPPPGSMEPAPAPPVVDPHPTLTAASSLTFTGTATGAAQVEVVGPAGFAVAPVVADAFTVQVGLGTNQLNKLFFTALAPGGTPSAAVVAEVTQDLQPPSVFIDFPPAGAQITTATVDVAGRVSDLLSGFQGLAVDVNGLPAAVDVGIGTNGTFFLPALPLDPSLPTVITAVATDFLGNAKSAQITVQKVAASGPTMVVAGGGAQSLSLIHI